MNLEQSLKMQLNNIIWNKNNYDIFINYLKENADNKYRDFHKSLIKENINLIGIRTPILKDIARNISKSDYLNFIKNNNHFYYEEVILHGLVISNLKLSIDEVIKLLYEFLEYNNNWAINDIVAASLKIFKKYQIKGFEFINKLINSKSTFNIRFGIVLLLDHYINDNYIDNILEICTKINNDDYYVKMAVAWLISICYIKYKDKTLKFINTNCLDIWTHNKAIQKIIESKRISNSEKEQIRLLKR